MQTHLKGFGLENFRVFKDYTWFDFAPITILTGPNSSGKSSLNKALLLLKDNFEKKNLPPYYTLTWHGIANSDEKDLITYRNLTEPTEEEYWQEFTASTLNFDGKAHNLYNTEDIKSIYSNSNIISFSIPFEINIYSYNSTRKKNNIPKFESEMPEFDIFFHNTGRNTNDIQANTIHNQETNQADKNNYDTGTRNVIYELNFKIDKNNRAKSLSKLTIKDQYGQKCLEITDKSIHFDLEVFDRIRSIEGITLSSIFTSYNKTVHYNTQIELGHWFSENGLTGKYRKYFTNLILDTLGISIQRENSTYIRNIKYTVKNIEDCLFDSESFSTTDYNQRITYTAEDNSTFKSILHTLKEAESNGFKFKEFFNICMNLFNTNKSLNLKYDKNQETYFPNIDGKSFSRFGYGYSVLAFLIFKIAEIGAKKYVEIHNGSFTFSGNTSLLILEEPESHLHPKFQSLLADFIIEAANTFNIQFIIETHSEYLIRKLQYLTAKKTIEPEDSVIYYFHEPTNVPVGQKQVKKIEIQEDGSLSDDFGLGFFDEAAQWELELLRLKNQKARNN